LSRLEAAAIKEPKESGQAQVPVVLIKRQLPQNETYSFVKKKERLATGGQQASFIFFLNPLLSQEHCADMTLTSVLANRSSRMLLSTPILQTGDPRAGNCHYQFPSVFQTRPESQYYPSPTAMSIYFFIRTNIFLAVREGPYPVLC
jgi:hypothetical protein